MNAKLKNLFIGLVWLAGYARSGAALIRTILAHCFGHQTASMYPEAQLGEAYCDAVKLLPSIEDQEQIMRILGEQKVLTVKTHQGPAQLQADWPAIVIVRDARRIFGSLRDYYRDQNRIDVSMRDIIMGHHFWGDWSEWVKSWIAHDALPTLWVKYEAAKVNPMWTAHQLSHWLGIGQPTWNMPEFEELHKINPNIWRKADMTGNGGMTQDEEELFWDRHGSIMTMLGYEREWTLEETREEHERRVREFATAAQL